MDGLIIWTVGRVQAERAARTRALNRTQYTEKLVFEFCRGKKRKHMEKTGFPGGSVVKNLPAKADVGSIPGLERSPGGGNGHPLQYSCLRSPLDRGAWRATAHGVIESDSTE